MDLSELETLRQAADERGRHLEATAAELVLVAAEAERRLELINELTSIAQERLKTITLDASKIENLERALGESQASRNASEEKVASLERRNEELTRAAEERLAALKAMDGAAASIRLEAERRAVILSEMTELLERQEGELRRLRVGRR